MSQHKHKITVTIVKNTIVASEKSLISELKHRFPELKNSKNSRRLNVNHDSSTRKLQTCFSVQHEPFDLFCTNL